MTVITAQMALEARDQHGAGRQHVNQHSHIWTYYDNSWSCAECTDQTPTCIVNTPTDDEHGHPTRIPAQNICENCHRHEQVVLDDTASALGHWQHQPRSLVPAIRYDRDKTTGSRTENDRPTVDTPADILDVLWSWADMWADTRGDTATGDVLTFLKRHLIWAANNPGPSAFNDYRSEMRQMRHAARRVSGLLPQRQAAPCVHCGGQIVQDWADENWQPNNDGLTDTLRCTGCGLTWPNHERWMYANGHSLRLAPQFAPDTLVTIDDARRHIFPDVPAATWRKWIQRDRERGEAGEQRRLPEHGTDPRGAALYLVSDLATHVEHRNTETRPGRRAG